MAQARSQTDGKQAILICEDDPVQGRVLQDFLEKRGWPVVGPCTTPEMGVAEAHTSNLCAAILDVSLDGGSAADVASILRGRGVPFAFVTAYGPATAATLGAFSDTLVVPKPVTPDVLDQILETLLHHHPDGLAST